MNVIVVRVDRVGLHSFGAKHSSVVKVGAASRSDDRRSLPFFDGRVPKIETHGRSVQRVVRAVREIIVFLNEKKRSARQKNCEEGADPAHSPEQTSADTAQSQQTQESEYDQTNDCARESAAAAGQKNTDITNSARVTDEQFAPNREATPADHAHAKNSKNFERTRKMIRANIKAARATAVIDTLKKFNRHEIVAIPELDRAD